MKLVTFEKDGKEKIGALTGEEVVDLSNMASLSGVTFDRVPSSVISFFETGERAAEAAEKAVKCARRTGIGVYKMDDLKLRAPIPRPGKLLCLATNYEEHAREGGGTVPPKEQTTPRVFMKPASNTVIGHRDAIVIPRNANWIDWECELAVVMGQTGKFIQAEEAYDYVGGYTVVNDISERSLEVGKERQPREGDQWFDWLNGKWFDTAAPMGPCLTLKDEIPDPHDLRITLRVNGETKQDSNTGRMTFFIPELIEWISTIVTLEPGDVIATGTPSGVGRPAGTFLKAGDVVESEVEGIGVLVNPVVAE